MKQVCRRSACRIAFLFSLTTLLNAFASHAATVDLSLQINGPPGRVSLGSNGTFTVTVSNVNSHQASGVRLTNELSAGLVFVSITTSRGSCTPSNGTIFCDLGNLPAKDSATITVRARPTILGYETFYASVGSSQSDENPEDNGTGFGFTAGVTDVSLTLAGPAESVRAGQVVPFTLIGTNRGPDPTAIYLGAILESVYRGNAEVISTEGYNATNRDFQGPAFLNWSSPVVPAGGYATVTVRVRPLTVGNVPIEAWAFPVVPEVDPNLDNNRASKYVPVPVGPGVFQFARALGAERSFDFAYEGRGSISLDVDRIGGADGLATVDYRTVPITALPDGDYLPVSGRLTFKNGQTRGSFIVPILSAPGPQCARDFRVELANPTGGFVQDKTNLIVTIFDEDVVPAGTTVLVQSNKLTPGLLGLSTNGKKWMFESLGDLFLQDAETGAQTLLTVNSDGTGPLSERVRSASLSGDGRFTAFEVPGAAATTNSVNDQPSIYVRDAVAAQTRLVSISIDGVNGGNNPSSDPLISSNGQVVVFRSFATDLVPTCPCDGVNLGGHLYARDWVAGTTELITSTINGTDAPTGSSVALQVSHEGRYVLYQSDADNLVVGDTNGLGDLFLWDRSTHMTELISRNATASGSGNGETYVDGAQLSANARFVLFTSAASDLVPGDANGLPDVFLRDRETGVTRLISANVAGTNAAAGTSWSPTLTADARFVAFVSDATNLVNRPLRTGFNLFVRDTQSGTTEVVSLNCDGRDVGGVYSASFSSDGMYLLFITRAIDVVPGSFAFPSWGYPLQNVYRLNMVTRQIDLITANYPMTGGVNGEMAAAVMSPDGKVVLFDSVASNMTFDSSMESDLTALRTYAWRELPPGPNAEVRVTSRLQSSATAAVLTLAVTNFGPDSATGVMLHDTLSPGVSVLTASGTAGIVTVAGAEVTAAIGTLPRRGGAVVTVIVAPTADGTQSHQAMVTTTQPDPYSPNNAVADSMSLGLPPVATLALSQLDPRIIVNWIPGPSHLQLFQSPIPGGGASSWRPAAPSYDNGVLRTYVATNAPGSAGFYQLLLPVP